MKRSVKSRVSRVFPLVAFAVAIILAVPGRADDRAVKSKVAPIYPDIARRLHVEGMVSIQATVDAGGNVTEAKATGGNALLGPAAEDAVRKWKFDAGSGNATVKVNVEFSLAH